MYYYTTHPSPVGEITLACDGVNLAGLWMAGQKYHGDTIPEEMTRKDNLPLFDAVRNWLDRYLSKQKPAITELPLAPVGGNFRQNVWNIFVRDTLWKSHHLRRYRKKNGRQDRQKKHVQSGSRRGSRTQSHLQHHPLPSSSRGLRQPDRLLRRHQHKNKAAGVGRRGHVFLIHPEERYGPVIPHSFETMSPVLVLFEVTVKPDGMNYYLAIAEKLKEELAHARGFLRAERFSSLTNERKLLSLSMWENEASVNEWRNQQNHRRGQAKGRHSLFEHYSITVVTPLRSYTDKKREKAPEDSNELFGC